MLCVIAIVLSLGLSEALMVCPPNACATVRCASVTAENCLGEIHVGGGYCGCCDACVTLLGEGQSCWSTLLLGVPASARCDDGLRCEGGKCVSDPALLLSKRSTGPCAVALQQYQAQQPLLGSPEPKCDSDGYYVPKQCSGSECYCVSKDGQKIQDYTANIWESQHQTCQCARDQYEYMQTGLIGRLFFCTPDGSYRTYKCTGSVCHCVDTNGNVVGTQAVNIGELNSLKC